MDTGLMQEHLQTFIEDAIKKKFILEKTITVYDLFDKKMRDRVIDQGDLLSELHSKENPDTNQLTVIDIRHDQDIKIRGKVQDILNKRKEELTNIILSLQEHLIELTRIEINNSGFIAHAIAHDYQTTFTKETKTLIFKEKGHAEYAISTHLTSWQDSSQFKISIKE